MKWQLTKLFQAQMAVEEAGNMLESAQVDYLRHRGWTESCNYPASLWLWSRTLPDGRTISVPQNYATKIEMHLDNEALGARTMCFRVEE